MKILYIATASLLLLLSACKDTPKLNLTIKAKGISNGVVILKQANEITFNEQIKNGELIINKGLQAPGYYTLTVIDSDKPITSKIAYDIYLENGDYVVNANTAKPAEYPAVTTTSATQKELSDYYKIAYTYAGDLDAKIDQAIRYLQTSAARALPADKRAKVYADTRELQRQRRDLDLKIIREYTDKYPKATIGAHIIAQAYFPEHPAEYNAIFQKLPADVKTSDDGLKISNKLGPALQQIAGAEAPEIVGSTPAGKPFDKKAINKKIILVEFWKPGNATSEMMHARLVQGIILTPADNAKLAIISVAIADKTSDWLAAIKKDNAPFTQVSDGKGDASPNVTAWEIKSLPMYCLLDKNWKVIKTNVPFGEIDTEVHDYLRKK